MKAPLKVLIGFTLIAVALIVVVFYRYDIIAGIKRTSGASTQTASAPVIENLTPPAASSPTPTGIGSATSPALANGKKLFEEKTCALCHGANGKADTPTGQAMHSTDLTLGTFHSNKNNMEATAYILSVIDDGVPGTAMVGFKSQIPQEQDRKDLAAYIHSLSK